MTTTVGQRARPVASHIRQLGPMSGWWRWAAVPFAVVYLILLATQFADVVTSSSMDADAVSAPVIGELFGAAPAQAHVVLGTFGWYSTLLFELATKWAPGHRQVWEAAPYAMVLAAAALTAWPVAIIAGRVAASLAAVIVICAAPPVLHVLMSMTQHAPVWFCLALLGAFGLWLQRPRGRWRPIMVAPLVLAVGLVIGINAASDPLITIGGLAPFMLALGVGAWMAPRGERLRTILPALAMLGVAALAWVGTDLLMAALNVAPQPGLHKGRLASPTQIGTNFRLWWHSIALIGNGNFFNRDLSFVVALAVACALLSIGAVVALPWLGWRELRAAARVGVTAASPARGAASPPPGGQIRMRVGFLVFWCSSALLLTGAFLISTAPGDTASYRYLIGLVFAAGAVIPILAAARPIAQILAVAATCVFALSATIGMGQRIAARRPVQAPEARVIPAVQRLAGRHHLQIGYAGYWDAAPITWGTHYRVQVYPVAVCDRGAHLCPFDLHVISSWYEPRAGARSFLLTDTRSRLVVRPTPDLGRPDAVYHLGQATMYVYPYDISRRLAPT